MKYFVAIALIVAVASAAVIKPTAVSDEMSQVAEIIAAISSPNTDPATAALLEQMLFETLGISPEPIAVGPAIVDAVSPVTVVEASPVAVVDAAEISPIAVGPEIIDFPLPDGGALTEVEPAVVAPAPAVVVPVAAESSPLVQIIVNVNGAAAGSNPVAVVAPEAAAEAEIAPTPVSVVESAPIVPSPVVLPEAVQPVVVAPEPVIVVESAPEPVQVAEPVIPEPVVVVEPEALEPVAVGEPSLPVAVQPVVLPETLN